jgi:phage terminase large subunit-like protein
MTPAVRNLREGLRRCTSDGITRVNIGKLCSLDVDEILFDWLNFAREAQLPPIESRWHTLLLMGGRGSGKTRAGAEWVRARACGLWPATGEGSVRIALVAPTLHEARAVMIEGKSGLLAVHDDAWRPKYEPSKRLVTWPNGAIAQVFSADEPESLRGPQFDCLWADELAKWKHAEHAWDMIQFALRLGDAPRAMVTTTPRVTPLMKRLIADEGTLMLASRTADNRMFLAESFIKFVTGRYANTRLGRQELDGEMIEDDPGALFKRGLIDQGRVSEAPAMERIVVAVDPPASHGKRSSACGIVCAGLGHDGRCYVLEDATLEGARPAQWAARVISVYQARQADRVVAEVNQGGAMVEQVLREVDPDVPFRAVHANRGKQVRAEPVAALYEQERVSHVGAFPALEDEMCQKFEKGMKSPDRLDALVWAVSELMLRRAKVPRVRVL